MTPEESLKYYIDQHRGEDGKVQGDVMFPVQLIIELLEDNIALKTVLRHIYAETTTDHYGDSLIALENIDKILEHSRKLWEERKCS